VAVIRRHKAKEPKLAHLNLDLHHHQQQQRLLMAVPRPNCSGKSVNGKKESQHKVGSVIT
jgi:hypothetical protein